MFDDDDDIFPESVFPEAVFPREIFTPEVFPRTTKKEEKEPADEGNTSRRV